jgi:DNA-binding NarL/FixJ family response regulator
MTIRVLVADDHVPTRSEIRRALELDPRFTVCGEASDAAAAVELARRRIPHVCVLDISMPGNGIAAAYEITGRLPQTRVLMLTVSDDDDDLFAALRAGASGYLLKDTDADRLADLVAAVAEGESVLSPALVARVLDAFRDRSPRRRRILVRDPSAQELTSREWEVLELLRQGLSTRDIGSRLVLSDATVRSHVANILRKLRVPDRDSLLELFPATDRSP